MLDCPTNNERVDNPFKLDVVVLYEMGFWFGKLMMAIK